MKKLVALLVVIAVVAMPSMAATTISVAQTGTNAASFTVSYSYDGVGSAPRAFALDIATSVGTISGVTAAKTGESTSASKGFGIFPGTIAIDTAAGTISNIGSPIAPYGDTPVGGTKGGVNGTGYADVTVELGSLYADSTGKPATSGVLVTVTLAGFTSGSATITVTPNTARGGIVLEDASSVGTFTATGTLVIVTDCFPSGYATYADFLSYKARGLNPNCWCAKGTVPEAKGFQCDGDADGLTEGTVTKYRVSNNDLNILKANWQKKITQNPNPCADFDHKYEGSVTRYRVSNNDLNVLKANWQKKDSSLGNGTCPRGS